MPTRSSSDKFLLIIVAGIILLVIVSFIVIANRPQPQAKGEDTAEGVVHNYLLAIQSGDYERAYGYLSPEIAYPADVGEFYDSLREQPWEFTTTDNYSLVVESSEVISDQSIAVNVRQIFNNNALFGATDYEETFNMRTEEIDGDWKLVSGERFWSSCWGEEDKCENGPVRTP